MTYQKGQLEQYVEGTFKVTRENLEFTSEQKFIASAQAALLYEATAVRALAMKKHVQKSSVVFMSVGREREYKQVVFNPKKSVFL